MSSPASLLCPGSGREGPPPALVRKSGTLWKRTRNQSQGVRAPVASATLPRHKHVGASLWKYLAPGPGFLGTRIVHCTSLLLLVGQQLWLFFSGVLPAVLVN